MVNNVSVERTKSSASSVSTKKEPSSKSLLKNQTNDAEKKGTSSPTKKEFRGRSKTAGSVDVKGRKTPPPTRQASADSWMLYKGKSETNVRKMTTDTEQEESDEKEQEKKNSSTTPLDKGKESNNEIRKGSEGHKRVLVYEKPSETYSKLLKEGNPVKSVKPKAELSKRPSEIPKLKQLATLKCKYQPQPTAATAPVPSKSLTRNTAEITKTSKPTSQRSSKELQKSQSDPRAQATKPKKETKLDDKLRHAMKENFTSLVPLYEVELKKITDTWVNTVYCSLTLRNNLVKLLYEAMPGINRSQFHMEDEIILQSLARAKSYTRSEAENLIQFIRVLLGTRNKAKEEYTDMITNIEIAESHSNNWRALNRKIVEIGDETKQLQMEVPQLMKKKENYEIAANERIQKMESSISQREEEIKKLENQLGMLRQRENSYKGNISMKIEDYKDIKEEVLSLKSMEKEFEELKTKYHCQNDVYEKKIKDLEILLEERKKTLKKEKEVKKQLRAFLVQLHTHQQHLYRTVGKDQVDFVMGRLNTQGKTKRRDQLWLSAIKLVLKGFLVQMKRLERDRNKMLLKLSANDLDNYNSLATAIMQKDNFIKSIRQQMNAFSAAAKYPTAKTSESSMHD